MKFAHVFVLLLLPFSGASQKKFTISGYVSDRNSQERITGAIIYDTRSKSAANSNAYGFFSLTLPADSVTLAISYIGYRPQKRTLVLSEDLQLNIDLHPDNELQAVEVVAQGERIEEKTSMSTVNVPIETIKKVPAIFGEVDVLKVLQLLPGVKGGGDGTAGIYVRGGGPDQNLILLDGAPVYNASHLFGFFSTFNADAIKRVELIKGGFPARYGGRLSSVIDIGMKEGNMRHFNVEGGIGIISSRILVEGPIWKDRTSFIVTARRTYIDALIRPIIRATEDVDGGYYFYDLNAKLNHKISERDRVYFSVYHGLDRFFFRSGDFGADESTIEGFLKWGNTLGALRWNHVFNSRLFLNTSLTYTRYRFSVGQEMLNKTLDTRETLEYFSGINDWAGRVEFEYTPAPPHSIRFGGNYIYHTFNTGAVQFETEGFDNDIDSIIGNKPLYATDFNVFAEDDWKLSRHLKVSAGVHAAGFLVQNTVYPSVQPRVSGRYLLPANWSVKASYAMMTQFIHLLSNSNIGLPTDLWVPATKRILPQQSQQVAAGFAKSMRDNMFELSIEGYYKWMDNIIDYLEGADFIGGSDWERKVAQGKGWSYGAEFLLQKKTGRYTGWIGYTLSWTERQFREINLGRPYPYRYDRRHDVSLVNVYKINDVLDVSLTWVFGTGNAISLPLQSYQGMTSQGPFMTLQYYGSKNNYRMAPYHRLDFGVNWHRKKQWGTATWNFGAYNVYARQNPYFLYFRNDGTKSSLMQVSLFSIIPSISWNFKFDFKNFRPLKPENETPAEIE